MQEITVVVIVDTQAAVEQNSLDGNIYLIDNLRTEGSVGEGTQNLISAVNGAHWIDRSQSGEYIFNWLPYAISGISPSLPKLYQQNRTKVHNKEKLVALKNVVAGKAKDKTKGLSAIADTIGINSINKNTAVGGKGDELKLLDYNGNVLSYSNHDDLSNVLKDLTDQTPQITDITGDAIDKGVIFPAQYGTPTQIKDGWYWSASTDSSKIGEHSYTLHITLHKPTIISETEVVWEPMYFTHEAFIKVKTDPMVNGFTNAECADLPIL